MQNDHDTAGLLVSFYYKAIKNEQESEAQGYPVYKDQERVKIVIAGDKNTVIDRKASEEDRARFASHYERFKNKNEQAVDGFPLENWPQLTVSQVALLKEFNIFTVEAMASVSDSNVARMGPGVRALRDKALEFMRDVEPKARQTERMQSLEAENSELKDRLEELEAKMAAFTEGKAVSMKKGKKHDAA